MIASCSPYHAIAGISNPTPYTAVGTGAKWFSPIQPVAKGINESQNSRCMLAHSIMPLEKFLQRENVLTAITKAEVLIKGSGEIHLRSNLQGCLR